MNRRAKIVATLGPSQDSVQKIEDLIMAGANVFRINMSHATQADHKKMIQKVRQASLNTSLEVGILCDLQGPKIRVDKLKEPLELKKDDLWYMGTWEQLKASGIKPERFIPTVYEGLVDDAKDGDMILFDDGLMDARAIEHEKGLLKIQVNHAGLLKSNKGINLPDSEVSAPSLTEKDYSDLIFGVENEVDFIALSFVRKAEDIIHVKNILHKMKVKLPIIAKIERYEAVLNIDQILDVTDAIMIARGDMGVEIGNHLVPGIQKTIIKKCNERGTPVITATQMLETMTHNPRPTRAEASDVANAIWDGTDACMLSGETASGAHPVGAVKMMNQIMFEAEKKPAERPLLRNMDLSNVSASIQVAGSIIAEKNNARWIIAVSESGSSCVKMSRFRPQTRVLGVTNSKQTLRRISLYWGITPYYYEEGEEDLIKVQHRMIEELKTKGLVKNGDKIVITHGDGKYFKQGSSNSVRLEIVKNITLPQENKADDHVIVEKTHGRLRMLLDQTVCASCHTCVQTCPHSIWQINRDSGDTEINESQLQYCAQDMQCVEECPTGAIELIPTDL